MALSLRERLLGRAAPAAPDAPPTPAGGEKPEPSRPAAATPETAAPTAPTSPTAPTAFRPVSAPPHPTRNGSDGADPQGGRSNFGGSSALPNRLAGSRVPGSPSAMSGLSGMMSMTSTMMARRGEAAPLSAVEQLKVDLHRKLIDRLDLAALERIRDEQTLAQQIRAAVVEFLRAEQAPLSATEREDVIEQIVYEVTGLGPLEPLFRDPTISDILVNGPRDCYIERKGKLQRVSVTFRDNTHLLTVIDRIVSRVGRRVDESSPMVDARLPDGSRVNAIIPPLALDGPVLSIRRFGAEITAQQLVEKGAMTDEMLYLLAGCVHARLNIIISGGTGSGKTTLLNALSSFIPNSERVVTIEDAAELRLQQEHVVRLETRPPNSEGRGEVLARDLVKNALRMRPDRIILGECRGAEALDMLQAMNTGHEGSLATIHANTPRDALARLETMILFAGTNLPNRAMREQISSAIDVIVQTSRLADGSRRVVSITEVTNMEGDIITSQELYRFRRRGVSPDGMVVGDFEPTGVRPLFTERLRVAGIDLSPAMFTTR
jgi:pilus assembly protein CpaF